ncbi:hypothetical protein E4W41_20110 [Klebsiella pneumoniae]|uniref:hypothetical protein n=1 Tax=Klebsiella pneumoniae TaxID=573 RepID=UPI000E2DA3E3|nr:hypothetical protein [Klebsiella pneumoniae]NHX58872.1 hypothetical protein [Klebsiella pneumoniae]NHY09282.1 hypothetical protein [Klebsiella pneumoniae]SVS74659.1 Uncharacterised protein [Klebsiella pneumoniae]
MNKITIAQLKQLLLSKKNINIDSLYYDPTDKIPEVYLYDIDEKVICYYSPKRGQWMVQPQNLYNFKKPRYAVEINDLTIANWEKWKLLK